MTRNLADEELTQTVLASFGGCASERFREIMQSLVRHLHAFASEVALTEEEWSAGIDFLTRTGHMTDDERQEFILLSDVLGLSMLVIALNNRKPAAATPSTVFGPFFAQGSPGFVNGDDIGNGAPGEPCQHLLAAEDGRYWFWSIKPTAYPIPVDGPVGQLVASANRSPMRPAHIHFLVSAPGYQTLTTHVFADGDPYLDSDAVFGVKNELIAPLIRHPPGRAADGRDLDRPYWSITYDIVLTPGVASGRRS